MLDQSDHIFDTTNYVNITMNICFCQNCPIMVKSIRRYVYWQREMTQMQTRAPDNETHRLRSPDFIGLRGALQNLTTGLRPKVGVNSHIF